MKLAKRGFTLLEVVVAIALFAISAIMLATAYVGVLNSYELATKGLQRDEDMRFARELLLQEADLETASEGGEFETPDHRKVNWSAEITPLAMPDLFRVEFICETKDDKGSDRRTESFVVLRPTWSEAGDRDKLRSDVRERIQELNTQSGRGSSVSSSSSSSAGTGSRGTGSRPTPREGNGQ